MKKKQHIVRPKEYFKPDSLRSIKWSKIPLSDPVKASYKGKLRDIPGAKAIIGKLNRKGIELYGKKKKQRVHSIIYSRESLRRKFGVLSSITEFDVKEVTVETYEDAIDYAEKLNYTYKNGMGTRRGTYVKNGKIKASGDDFVDILELEFDQVTEFLQKNYNYDEDIYGSPQKWFNKQSFEKKIQFINKYLYKYHIDCDYDIVELKNGTLLIQYGGINVLGGSNAYPGELDIILGDDDIGNNLWRDGEILMPEIVVYITDQSTTPKKGSH